MNGVINIFKPKGMTSFDVVREVKKIAKMKKVGHTGTLDPDATGVLPVCLGKATKIIDYIMNSEKTYEVEFILGLKTTTYDTSGDIVDQRDPSHLTENEIKEAVNSFLGTYSQVPPMYSALKKNGVRLYELARKGIEIEREGRDITIYSIENLEIANPKVKMTVSCSKGTYIRSLCYDIGEKLGVFAAMSDLNRSKTSVFTEENSINIKELTSENIQNHIISIDEALDFYEELIVEDKWAKLLINGVNVFDTRMSKEEIVLDKLYRVYDVDHKLIGLGSRNSSGFKIEKLLIT